MKIAMTRPLVLSMAARVRRLPARATTEQAKSRLEHLRWWREQAAEAGTHTTAPPSADVQHHVLYRFYGVNDVLLYVGITLNLPVRLKDHSRTKPWWHDVTHMTVEHFSNRSDVLAAEKFSIINERPLYNATYSGEWYRRVETDNQWL